jgi:uncharacterized protein (TIGR03118 family)
MLQTHSSIHRARKTFSLAFACLLLLAGLPVGRAARTQESQTSAVAAGTIFRRTNFISDAPGVAPLFDPQFSASWGAAVRPGGPLCVAGGITAQFFRGIADGGAFVPDESQPTLSVSGFKNFMAVVANTTGTFNVAQEGGTPAPAHFIFALGSDIAAWQPAMGNTVRSVVSPPGNSLNTGLALGLSSGGLRLYATKFPAATIAVYDGSFTPTAVPGGFLDPTVPADYFPYNIQNLEGSLYVTYAKRGSGANGVLNGVGLGMVRKFSTDGVRDLAFAVNDGPTSQLNAPWGLAIAPASFGDFGDALLVGNFADRMSIFNNSAQGGRISAYNKGTGAFLGTLQNEAGLPLEIDGLRTLFFGTGDAGTIPGTLYFTAEFGGESRGVFGALTPTQLATSLLQFSSSEYVVNNEGFHIDVTVTRSGNLSGSARVNYATFEDSRLGGGARQKGDYQPAIGTLTFNPGETSKTFRVLTVNDTFIEGDEFVLLALTDPSGSGVGLGSQDAARVKIIGGDVTFPEQVTPVNDSTFFVPQHYYDFLNREPDLDGFSFWFNQIEVCGSADLQCREVRRINVSAAFFLSIEFQTTGALAYLTNKAAFASNPDSPAPVLYGQFEREVQLLQQNLVFGQPGFDAQLEANKRAYFDYFVTRPEFVNKYGGVSNSNYVATLLANASLAQTVGNVYIARLDGSQVVPPNGSSATGALVLRRDPFALDHASITLSLNALSSPVTAVEIRGPAAPGTDGPLLFTLPPGEFVDAQVTLTQAQISALNGGQLYVIVRTQSNPGGEIRGQIPSVRLRVAALTEALDNHVLTRAQVLRIIAEFPELKSAEFNRMFVTMEYFGYLRRDPDAEGLQFWVSKLIAFNGDYIGAEMVKAFISSTEYRTRFGPNN